MNKSCDHPLADGRKAGCAGEVKFVCDCNKCRREDPVCACEEHFAAVAEHHRRIYGGLPLWRAVMFERKEPMSTITLGGHSLSTFSIHERRLHLTHHPDAERGQYVLVAVYGSGDSPFGGAHELCICLDDAGRQRLIDVLQSDPEQHG